MFVCLVVPHFLLSDQVTCYHTNPTFGPERSAHLSPTETILQFARCFSWNPLKLSLHRTVLFFFFPEKHIFTVVFLVFSVTNVLTSNLPGGLKMTGTVRLEFCKTRSLLTSVDCCGVQTTEQPPTAKPSKNFLLLRLELLNSH